MSAKSRKEAAVGGDVFTALCRSALSLACYREYRFHDTRRWRFDYALPSVKIAVEVEGGVWSAGRHVRPKGFLADMEKYNTAAAMGWTVLRTTPAKLMSADTVLMISRAAREKQANIVI